MLKKVLIFFLVILSVLCHAQAISVEDLLIRGSWENSEDSKSTLTITDRYIIEKYNGALIDTFSYRFTYMGCDTTTKDSCGLNTLFLLETNIHNGYSYCYHITKIDETTLTLDYTFNGYEAVFRRRKE
ncbi:MAG: hypothetical protein M0D57_11195 [Sphingobacteriales bacterium JAD_PAG50586_3]|nr:MAG: hypothetical protein M0D57_11195 [Sphingobacteriales bacterium JAD_PAG50586_3]